MTIAFNLDRDTVVNAINRITNETQPGILKIVAQYIDEEHKRSFKVPVNQVLMWERVAWLVLQAKEIHGEDVCLHDLPLWLVSCAVNNKDRSQNGVNRLVKKLEGAYSSSGKNAC